MVERYTQTSCTCGKKNGMEVKMSTHTTKRIRLLEERISTYKGKIGNAEHEIEEEYAKLRIKNDANRRKQIRLAIGQPHRERLLSNKRGK